MTEEAPRRSPAYAQYEDLGAVMTVGRDWEVPYYFERNEERREEFDVPDHGELSRAVGVEHMGTRDSVGITSLIFMAPIEIKGDSAGKFVQRMFSNDMAIDINQIRYAMMLNETGGVMGDIVLDRLSENRYFAFTVGGPVGVEHTEWLQEHAPADVSVTNLDNAYTCLCVWGPDAREVVQPLTDADMSPDVFPFFRSRDIDIEGIPVRAIRVSYAGEFGWELWTPMGYESQLWETLWAAGQDADATPFGLGALLSLAVEKNYRLLGVDMGPDHDAFETGFGFVVDMDTDFIGKEALERTMEDGLAENRSCITMDDETVHPEAGDSILVDGTAIGAVARSTYGYSVGETIINAFLPAEHADAGTAVEIECDGERHAATVREAPLFDPDGERLRG